VNHEPTPLGNWFLAWPAALPQHWISKLQSEAPAALRWFHPLDCHVTLVFFGRIALELADEISERLVQSVPQQFIAKLGPLHLLPSPRRFSAISFAIDADDGALARAIAEQRDEWRSLAALPPEHREPLPHLTVARPERRAHPSAFRRIQHWAEKVEPHPGPVPVGPLSLYTWSLDRTKRQFRVIATAGGSPPAAGEPAPQGSLQ
jgi:2'-5' RNA ligase